MFALNSGSLENWFVRLAEFESRKPEPTPRRSDAGVNSAAKNSRSPGVDRCGYTAETCYSLEDKGKMYR
jgi:hypothetical protein